MTNPFNHFPKKIDNKQATDTGMAMVLILLLLGYFMENEIFYKISIPVLILNMIYPMIFYPIAIIWFGLSHILGSIVSKILLTLVFLLILVPVGFIRKLMGKDSLQLKAWKKNSSSVLTVRNKKFISDDMKYPF